MAEYLSVRAALAVRDELLGRATALRSAGCATLARSLDAKAKVEQVPTGNGAREIQPV